MFEFRGERFFERKGVSGLQGRGCGFFRERGTGESRLLKKNEYAQFSCTEQFKALSNE